MRGLYLHLDKKLSVHLDSLTLPKVSDGSNDAIDDSFYKGLIQDINTAHELISSMVIKELKTDFGTFNIAYFDEHFYAKGEGFKAAFNFSADEERLYLIMERLQIKALALEASGFVYKEKNDLGLELDIISRNLNLSLEGKREYDKLSLSLSGSMTEINRYKKLLEARIHPVIIDWVFNRALAKNYDIKHFNLELDLKNGKYQISKMLSLIEASDIEVNYNDKAPKAQVKKAQINIDNSTLEIRSNYGISNKDELNNVIVRISSMYGGVPEFYLELGGDNLALNQNILNILKAYNINLPLKQLEGRGKAMFNLGFLMRKPIKINYAGDFSFKAAKVQLFKEEIEAKELKVSMKNEEISFNALEAKNSFLKTAFSAKLNTKSKEAKFFAKNLDLNFGFFQFSDKDLELELSFKDKPSIRANKYALNILLGKELIIDIKDIKPFLPSLKIAQTLHIKGGELHIKSDYENYDILCKNMEFSKALFKANGLAYLKDDIQVLYSKDKLSVKSLSNFYSFKDDGKHEIISADNISLTIDDELLSTINSLQGSKQISSMKVDINQLDIDLAKYDKHLHFDSAKLDKIGSKISFQGLLGKSSLVIKKDQELLILAQNMDAKFLNDFLKKPIFTGGFFNLKAQGKDTDNLTGSFHAQNTTLSGLKSYQNLMAFINTVPNLLSLKGPSFNEKGMHINSAKIDFELKKDLLFITNFSAKSSDLDLLGMGHINLKSQAIDLELYLSTLKGISNVLGKIPVIGQILLGKDRQVSTKIEVKGSLEHMKFQTHIIKDLALIPFKLLKNIIELPANMLPKKE